MTPAPAGSRHLVLACIEDGVRALTIRVLGAYAEALGVRTTLLVLVKPLATAGRPLTFRRSETRQIARFLRREEVTHFGMYLMTATLKPYQRLVRGLREAGFRGLILAGGVHAALCPEESLVEGADFAVQGPGELPLKMLFEGADPAAIPGLVWRHNGAVVANPQTDSQRVSLDTLPFPIFRFGRDKVLLKGKLRPYTWRIHRRFADWHGQYYDLITSRGCPYKCAYCCRADTGAIRRASVDRVIGELKHLRAEHPEIAGVNIQDDAFFYGPEDWAREFCRRMKAEVGLPFIVRMIPKFVTPERLELLKSGGLEYVTMGLEGSSRLNRTLYKRPEDKASFLKAARAVLDAGLHLSVDVIIDNPYEKEEDLREVAHTLNALPRPNWGVVALSLTPFPHTPLYERAAKDGMLGRFATDAYDAMLMPTKEGGYTTPRFWRVLITELLPAIGPDVAGPLIAAGPADPNAVHALERLAKWTTRLRRINAFIRDYVPFLYRFLVRRQCRLGKSRSPK